MTDRDRIRRHLLAGNTVCVLDWDGSREVVDGGKPVKRVAARIRDLREEGLRIVKGPLRNKCATYTLADRRPVGLIIEVTNVDTVEGCERIMRALENSLGAEAA